MEPASRKVGAKMKGIKEASAQTYPKGDLLVRSSGFIQAAATGCPTTFTGVAARTGQNGATDGAKKASVWKFEHDKAFRVTLAGTWTDALRGATCALSRGSGASIGAIRATTGTGVSNSSCGYIEDALDWDNGPVANGDVNVVVLFVPADAAIVP
jgi:hypothetical protein